MPCYSQQKMSQRKCNWHPFRAVDFPLSEAETVMRPAKHLKCTRLSVLTFKNAEHWLLLMALMKLAVSAAWITDWRWDVYVCVPVCVCMWGRKGLSHYLSCCFDEYYQTASRKIAISSQQEWKFAEKKKVNCTLRRKKHIKTSWQETSQMIGLKGHFKDEVYRSSVLHHIQLLSPSVNRLLWNI